MTSFPPDAVWVLLSSTTMTATTLNSRRGHELRLNMNQWHCLPRSIWGETIASTVAAQKRAGDYSQYRVEVWQEPTLAPSAA